VIEAATTPSSADRELMEGILNGLARDIGERVCGSSGDAKAADFLARSFQEAGIDVVRQRVPFIGWELTRTPVLRVGPVEMPSAPLMYSGTTPEGGVSGVLEATGRIALIEGLYEYPVFNVLAETGQPVARVIVNQSGVAIPLINPRPIYTIPSVVVGREDGARIAAEIARNEVRATVDIGSRVVPDATTENIIGRLGPDDAERRIVFIAHTDSPLGSPGAYDNASGVAALFGIAAALQRDPLPCGVDLVAIAGEEIGFIGSRFYANDLHDRGLVSRIDVCICLDQVSGGDELWAWGGPESFEETVCELVHRDESAQRYPIVIGPSRPGSDDWPLREMGVKTACFLFWVQPEYHQATDVVDLVNWEKVEVSVGLAVALAKEVSDAA
jgi:aminopeptidase YwaD